MHVDNSEDWSDVHAALLFQSAGVEATNELNLFDDSTNTLDDIFSPDAAADSDSMPPNLRYILIPPTPVSTPPLSSHQSGIENMLDSRPHIEWIYRQPRLLSKSGPASSTSEHHSPSSWRHMYQTPSSQPMTPTKPKTEQAINDSLHAFKHKSKKSNASPGYARHGRSDSFASSIGSQSSKSSAQSAGVPRTPPDSTISLASSSTASIHRPHSGSHMSTSSIPTTKSILTRTSSKRSASSAMTGAKSVKFADAPTVYDGNWDLDYHNYDPIYQDDAEEDDDMDVSHTTLQSSLCSSSSPNSKKRKRSAFDRLTQGLSKNRFKKSNAKDRAISRPFVLGSVATPSSPFTQESPLDRHILQQATNSGRVGRNNSLRSNKSARSTRMSNASHFSLPSSPSTESVRSVGGRSIKSLGGRSTLSLSSLNSLNRFRGLFAWSRKDATH